MSSNEAFEIIEQINGISGHAKRNLLDQALTPYLQAAYNPYHMYYITTCSPGYGTAEFDNETWQILFDLRTRRISGNLAQDLVDMHTSRMSKQSAELFRRIINKDLRMGIGPKTINKVLPGCVPTHDIMLAKIFEENRFKGRCWGSPKIDGVRAIYKFGEFYSRNGHKYQGLDHLKEQLAEIRTPLDGELVVRNKTFQQASGLIRSDNPTPDAEFRIYELPSIKDPFPVRITMMDDLNHQFTHVHPVFHTPLYSIEEIYSFYRTCREQNFEGAMIKSWDYQYKGTRSYDWMKMKQIETLDLKIVGVFEGKGKYAGQLGGIIVDYLGKPVRVGSGFSDSQRSTFWGDPLWSNAKELIGRTAEVCYMEATDTGSLRHPRFITFRDDK